MAPSLLSISIASLVVRTVPQWISQCSQPPAATKRKLFLRGPSPATVPTDGQAPHKTTVARSLRASRRSTLARNCTEFSNSSESQPESVCREKSVREEVAATLENLQLSVQNSLVIVNAGGLYVGSSCSSLRSSSSATGMDTSPQSSVTEARPSNGLGSLPQTNGSVENGENSSDEVSNFIRQEILQPSITSSLFLTDNTVYKFI